VQRTGIDPLLPLVTFITGDIFFDLHAFKYNQQGKIDVTFVSLNGGNQEIKKKIK
jgi:hypothetical protein